MAGPCDALIPAWGRTAEVRSGSELGYAQRFQSGEIAQAANLDANDCTSGKNPEKVLDKGTVLGLIKMH